MMRDMEWQGTAARGFLKTRLVPGASWERWKGILGEGTLSTSDGTREELGLCMTSIHLP